MINQLTDDIFKLNGTPVAAEKASQKGAELWSGIVLFSRAIKKTPLSTSAKKLKSRCWKNTMKS